MISRSWTSISSTGEVRRFRGRVEVVYAFLGVAFLVAAAFFGAAFFVAAAFLGAAVAGCLVFDTRPDLVLLKTVDFSSPTAGA